MLLRISQTIIGIITMDNDIFIKIQEEVRSYGSEKGRKSACCIHDFTHDDYKFICFNVKKTFNNECLF